MIGLERELLASEATATLDGHEVVLPHPVHSVARVPERALELLASHPRGVVVLALDGVTFDLGARHLGSATVAALTSTFPSTSSTAWTTALTGCVPDVHGVLGAVQRRFDGALENLLDGSVIAGARRSIAPTDALARRPATVFERARSLGARPVVVAREMQTLASRWTDLLFAGAERWEERRPVAPPTDWLAVTTSALEEVDDVVQGGLDEPMFVWVYVNLDEGFHERGYVGIDAALRLVDERCAAWAASDFGVLAHADHGLCPTRHRPDLALGWERIEARCELPSGGAGRTRWLHPAPDRIGAVLADAAALLDGVAAVVTREELTAIGALGASMATCTAVGEVVAIATGSDFALPPPGYPYEHGSLTEVEMIVPVAEW